MVMREELASQPPHQAIPYLLHRHGGKIYGLGLRLCGNPEEAQDLVQETFLLAFRKWDQFEGRSDPSTWLYTIATRVCRRRHRRRAGEPRYMDSLSDLLPSREEGVVDLSRLPETPHDILERRETRDAVERAIAELPETFRLPLILKDLMELSLTEIARILGLKEGTVKTRLHRARLAVGRALAATLPKKEAPPPDHSRRVCLDLLKAKQEAIDRGVDFPVARDELCARCRSLFSTLDLTRDACRLIEQGELPAPLREALLEEIDRSSSVEERSGRGREP